jgi:uncharacterized membrane protein YkoI
MSLAAISLVLFAGQPSWRITACSAHDAPKSAHEAAKHEEHDEDRAREAVEKGEVLPLDHAVARLKETIPGEIARIELEKENGIWVYEFKVISPEGMMVEVHIDAKTGQLIDAKTEPPAGKAGD